MSQSAVERERWLATRDMAMLLAEVIRRMGASYGSADDWRRDVTTAVRVMELAARRAAGGVL